MHSRVRQPRYHHHDNADPLLRLSRSSRPTFPRPRSGPRSGKSLRRTSTSTTSRRSTSSSSRATRSTRRPSTPGRWRATSWTCSGRSRLLRNRVSAPSRPDGGRERLDETRARSGHVSRPLSRSWEERSVRETQGIALNVTVALALCPPTHSLLHGQVLPRQRRPRDDLARIVDPDVVCVLRRSNRAGTSTSMEHQASCRGNGRLLCDGSISREL